MTDNRDDFTNGTPEEALNRFVEKWLLDQANGSLSWYAEQAKKRPNAKLIADREAVEWAAKVLPYRMMCLKSVGGKLKATDRDELFRSLLVALAAAWEIGSKTGTSRATEIYHLTLAKSGAGKSSAARRVAQKLERQNYVAEQARNLRGKNPRLRVEDLITKIEERWDFAGECPSRRTLARYLSDTN